MTVFGSDQEFYWKNGSLTWNILVGKQKLNSSDGTEVQIT